MIKSVFITHNYKMDIKELQVTVDNVTKKNHPWEYARFKIIIDIVKKYLKKNSGRSVLDIGCGDVFFLTKFADKYPEFELIGVDIAFNQEIISEIISQNSKYKIRLFNNIHNITNLNEASIIFLMDVIEHIENDVDFLKDLISQDYIGQNTIVVITTPAFNTLYCNHDKWLGHYRRYSHALLKKHIEAADFSYIGGGYFFTSLLFPRCIQKLIEKFKKDINIKNQGIGNYKGGTVRSILYEKILLLDFYFFKIFRVFGIRVPGLSTYVICKKQL